jgi:hypothetical protein
MVYAYNGGKATTLEAALKVNLTFPASKWRGELVEGAGYEQLCCSFGPKLWVSELGI